jgi:hypothetical protein
MNVIVILGIIAASFLRETISNVTLSFIDVSAAIKMRLVPSANSNEQTWLV